MAINHPLKHYRQQATVYLRQARATRDPLVRRALFAAASLFQEKASRREDHLARRRAAPSGGGANHELAGYRQRSAEYWRRALATRDPILQGAFSALAGLFQEMASRRENRLAKRGTAAGPAGAARERRPRSLLTRTPFLRQPRGRTGA